MKERDYTTAETAYGDGQPMEGWALLRNAIIIRAVDDYTDCLVRLLLQGRNRDEDLLLECESLEDFFFGSWYAFLSSIRPEILISKCREDALATTKRKIKERLTHEWNGKVKGY